MARTIQLRLTDAQYGELLSGISECAGIEGKHPSHYAMLERLEENLRSAWRTGYVERSED